MTPISEIKQGCRGKVDNKGHNCGIQYLCPTCSALLKQAESFVEEIDKRIELMKKNINEWSKGCGKETEGKLCIHCLLEVEKFTSNEMELQLLKSKVLGEEKGR